MNFELAAKAAAVITAQLQGQKQLKVVGDSAKVVGSPANATELNTSQLIGTDQYLQYNGGQPMNARRASRKSYKVLANSQL